MEQLAYHDALTGLPNRAALLERLEAAVEAAAADAGSVALLYIDLDDFKLVNDSLGHAAGDEVLRQVTTRLRSVIRSTDVLARQGGDEFMILVPRLEADAGSAVDVADAMWKQVRSALDDPFTFGEAVFQVDASVGVSVFPEDAADAEGLQMHADAAMYSAKDSGGGCAVYEPRSDDPLARLSLAARMRRALANDEFEMHYQPIYELGDAPRMRGVEALIRWRDPQRGMIPPLDFIPVAEHTGVIDAIGDWVLGEVTRQARLWLDEGLAPNFGVNVSPRQLRRSGFAKRFASAIEARGLDPRRFVVELTESTSMLDADRSAPALHALRAAGLRLALDDFGAGYSSLARLRVLPVDVIKIDRAFLAGIPEDPQACAIVAAILGLADACGCDVVAEGIETPEHLAFLTGKGCRLGQGFHLGRPVPADEITLALREHLMENRRV